MLVGAIAGCSGTGEPFPVACSDSAGTFLRALAKAPAPVTVDGTRISACFPRSSSQGDVETIGATLTSVADELSTRVRAGAGTPALTQLGYLIGASERGAGRTEGIHYELMRRLTLDLAGLATHSPAYLRGLAAGRRAG